MFPLRVTAADAEQAQRRVAGSLRARGIEPGDRLAVVAGPSAEYLAVALGALRTGVVPVLLDPALTAPEQEALLVDARPALVVRGDDLPGLADGPPTDLAPWPRARPMLYTSGTTGTPKGVWTGVLDDADAAALLAEERDLWGFAADDVHLVVSPLHHSAPLRFAGGTLLAGGDVVLAGPFDVGRLGRAVAQHRPTTAFMVPTHLRRLLAAPGGPPPLTSFRLLAHAGAACPDGVKRRVVDAFPTGSVWEFYGSTEAQYTACSAAEWEARPGTVGRARPGRALRVDAGTDGDGPANDVAGIVWCRQPPHARWEYWGDGARTAAAWRDDECSVFDVGRLDGDGYLFLEGRRDDLIVTGGMNVYPLEVEQALLAHPGIEGAAVFPVASDEWGQAVVAAVVGDVDPDRVMDSLATRLAGYKRPKRIVVVPEIPVSATGKVRRSRLAADLGITGV